MFSLQLTPAMRLCACAAGMDDAHSTWSSEAVLLCLAHAWPTLQSYVPCKHVHANDLEMCVCGVVKDALYDWGHHPAGTMTGFFGRRSRGTLKLLGKVRAGLRVSPVRTDEDCSEVSLSADHTDTETTCNCWGSSLFTGRKAWILHPLEERRSSLATPNSAVQ